jgi:hypothetical protein
MLRRCRNANAVEYPNYGGRGVTVCERWHSFANFLEDMGERPAGLTLDRVNVDGHYTPENCRWATPEQQARNKRRSRHRHDSDAERHHREAELEVNACLTQADVDFLNSRGLQ